jgi:hypothetical protein
LRNQLRSNLLLSMVPQVLVLELVLVLALVLVVVQERVFPPSRRCIRTTLSNSMNAMCQRPHRWKL